ncbi:MAG: GNAT family N-acetyltransferase [Candidatus Hodarchaeales archaeon]|jgi:RimJ/RimL family protein N-acetyltransferase
MVLEGSLVILREEREDDMELLVTLRNNLDTQAWGKALPPDYTLPMYKKRFQERPFSYDPSEGRFIIVHKKTEEIIGMIVYSDLQPRFEATIGIAILKKIWGQGIAHDAQETLLRFLFVELGIRIVRLWTQSGNTGMVQLAQRSGFKISGRLRQAAFIRGNLYDTLIVDLLREEFFALHPELVDNLPQL